MENTKVTDEYGRKHKSCTDFSQGLGYLFMTDGYLQNETGY